MNTINHGPEPSPSTNPQTEHTILPDPVPEHPLLTGKPEIARGEHSIVLDKGADERVFKLVNSPADYFFLTADDRPRGCHFPTVYHDHGIIGRAVSGYPFHLIEMEKLYPLQKGSTAFELSRRMVDIYWKYCQQWSTLGSRMNRIALHHMASHPSNIGNSMQNALAALSDFVEEYQILPDILNADHLMARKDGTLVFCDPITKI